LSGTDATIATHIQVIVDRGYVTERMEGATKYLVPSTLGLGLIDGYNNIGFDKSLSKPQLRSEVRPSFFYQLVLWLIDAGQTEHNMVQVCQGNKTKHEMLEEALEQYKGIFVKARREFNKVILVSAHIKTISSRSK
jgi:DNA topoisomerase III